MVKSPKWIPFGLTVSLWLLVFFDDAKYLSMVMHGKHPANHDAEGEAKNSTAEESALQQGRDYYLENGLFVFTAAFLLRRGYCCESGCRHCPYKECER